MEPFYHTQLSPQELQQRLSQQSRPEQTQMQGQQQLQRTQQLPAGSGAAIHTRPQASSLGNGSVMRADSLDDIIQSSHSELQRRRSIPLPYNGQMTQEEADRRMSMMEFGGGGGSGDNQFRNFPFNNGINNNNNNNYVGMPNMSNSIASSMPGGGMPNGLSEALAMPNAVNGFSGQNMMQPMPTGGPTTYSQFNPDMINTMMPASFANMNMGSLDTDPSGMEMFTQSPLTAQFPPNNSLNAADSHVPMDVAGDGSMTASLNTAASPMDFNMKAADVGGQSFQSSVEANSSAPQTNDFSLGQGVAPTQQTQVQPQQPPAPTPSTLSREVSAASFSPHRASSLSTPPTAASQAAPSTASTPVTGPQTPGGDRNGKNVYSKSGFDMLRALWHVATRKNPEVHLGAVDMSCAFVVCDVSLNDCPIIYVSDNFQNLTGYSRHEIVGQNCRFLQAPDGKVEAGSRREFVDDAAVYNLKKKIHEGKEVQQSLINYRKGGKPFLNLLTMIPIPWEDPNEIRYIVGFQIDLVECPDAIASGQDMGGVQVNYKHTDIGQYIWTPPASSQWEPDNGQTLSVDDVSTLLQQFNPKGVLSDWHKQSWDKMLLENTDDVVHVLSLKGLFLYLSPSCKRVLEYDAAELAGQSLSSVCHPSDVVPVTREFKDAAPGGSINVVYRIRRKNSGYTWFESHGTLFVEQGKGRKNIILVGRKRPVFALSRRELEAHGGIGDSELWTKLSTSGMFLFVSSNVRSLLDLQPGDLVSTSIQELMRKESRSEFGRAIEKARRGKVVTCKHEVQNRRGQVLQAQTVLYPGDASEGRKPTFLLAQTKLLKASSRAIAPAATPPGSAKGAAGHGSTHSSLHKGGMDTGSGIVSAPAGGAMGLGSQDSALAADDNIFDELRTTKCSSWQFELRQMEKVNRILAEELGGLLSSKKKRKRRKGVGNVVRDCANCHTRNTPEWRRGPSGQRDLCNSCGLRWAKQTGRVSPRNSSRGANNNTADASSKRSNSPIHSSPLHREFGSNDGPSQNIDTSKGNSTPGVASPNNHSSGPAKGTAANTTINTSSAAAAATAAKVHATMPPPSQPTLEGGSGIDITSIREERENNSS